MSAGIQTEGLFPTEDEENPEVRGGKGGNRRLKPRMRRVRPVRASERSPNCSGLASS